MSETSKTSKIVSFYQLINDHKIIIPKMQRDYAQGRDSAHEIRTNFVESLYNYLKETQTTEDSHYLDFIYGTFKNNEFIPLDGQQRLTTLFLLHWYLARQAGMMDDIRKAMLDNGYSKFSYSIRPSTSEFCDALLNKDIPDKNNQDISKIITDQNWYFGNNDPSIRSMLVMLDAIEKRFKGEKDFYILLTKDAIKFYLLDLEEYSLTDELYITMNSRGKQLTSFEALKARFEKFLRDAKVENSGRSAERTFSENMDGKWADLMWQYKEEVGTECTYDRKFVNLFSFIFYTHDVSQNENSKPLPYNAPLSFSMLVERRLLTAESMTYLMSTLDILYNGCDKIKNYAGNYVNIDDIFQKILNDGGGVGDKIVFYAYIKYLLKHNTLMLEDFMQIVFNLVENSRSAEEIDNMHKILPEIDKLVKHGNNILQYFADNGCKHFDKGQIREEKVKAKLKMISPAWKDAVRSADSIEYFSGQSGYLLSLSNILTKVEKGIDLTDKDLTRFIDLSSKVNAVYSLREKDYNKAWERSLLAKSDSNNYTEIFSGNRYNLLHSDANKREYSWKNFLRLIHLDQYAEKWTFITKVLDDPKFNKDDVLNSLEEICKKPITKDPVWLMLIKTPALLKYSEKGFIYINDGDVRLYKETKSSCYHHNLYVYNYYLNYIAKAKEIQHFAPKAEPVKSIKEASCARIDVEKYILSLHYEPKGYAIGQDKWENLTYCLFLERSTERKTKFKDKALINKIKSIEMKPYYDYNESGYYLHCKEKEIMKNILKIIKYLKK